MKILSLYIKNIASLAGEHFIDFTREPLHSAGLFLITGNTGSGKSTLLDAIALALYGRTPRYKRYTAKTSRAEELGADDARQLLHKGAAACEIRLRFTGLDGQDYCSSWGFKLSPRSKNYQKPEVSLIRSATDTLLSTDKEETLRLIEEKTGLTYEQFTRTVMLAQNEFTGFLKADDNMKAQLLEKLTGSEIFRLISKRIFEKAKEANAAYTAEKEYKDRLALLSDEELREIQNRKDSGEAEKKRISEQENVLHNKLLWHANRHRQEKERAAAQESWEQIKAEQAEARPLLQQYALLLDTAPAQEMARQAADLQSELAATDRDLAETRARIEEKRRTAEQCGLALARAEEQEEKLREEQKRQELLLIEAGKLDTLIKSQKEICSSAEIALCAAREQHREEMQKLAREQDRKKALLTEKAQIESRLEPLKSHSQSYENIDSILLLLDRAAENKTARDRCRENKRDIRLALEENERTLQELSRSVAGEEISAGSDEDIDRLLQGCTQAQERCRLLKEQRELQESLQEIRLQNETFDRRLKENREQLKDKKEQIAALDRNGDSTRNEIEVQTRILEILRIQTHKTVSGLRLTLEEGRPCPVCGSVIHPWSTEIDRQLNENLRREEAALQSRQELMEQIREQAQRAGQEQQDLSMRGELLLQQKQNAIARGREIEDKLKRFPAGTISKEAIRASEEALQDASNRYKKAIRINRMANERAVLQSRWESEQNKERETQEGYRQTIDKIDRLIDMENWQAIWEAQASAAQKIWAEQARDWKQNSGRLAALGHAIEQQDLLLGGLHAGSDKSREGVEKAQTQLTAALDRCRLLDERRRGYFEGRPTDVVQAQNEKALNLARSETAAQRRQYQQADKETTALSGTKESLKSRREQLVKNLEKAQKGLDRYLADYNRRTGAKPLGLSDLQELMRVDFDQRQYLGRLKADIEKRLAAAESRCITLQKQIQDHLSDKNRPEENETEAVLTEQAEVLRRRRETVEEALSEASAKILNHNRNYREAEALQQKIVRLQEKKERWDQLNAFIGQADGSKFQRMAQTHTLGILLAHANRQLKLLNTRYSLRQRNPRSLELEIVDTLMGDEVRPVHSLSGGESFIVSLGLALGLSSLQSNRLSIESLFIDEGFGSLDAESLNLIVNTLENLQSQGRKVGIISHLQELRERIGTQIQVQSLSGGRSKISIV